MFHRILGKHLRNPSTGLDAPVAGDGRTTAARSGRVGFLLSSRPPGFGRRLGQAAELLRQSPEFRASIADCDAVIREWFGWSLERLLLECPLDADLPPAEDRIEPTLTAIQIATTDLLASMGVVPEGMLAISGGEYAAGYVSGATTRTEAMEVACSFGRVQQSHSFDDGIMLMVQTPAAELQAMLEETPGPAHLACDFDPDSSCVSIMLSHLETLRRRLDARSIPSTQTKLGPFHSPLVSPWAAPMIQTAERLGIRVASRPLYSSIPGGRIETLETGHWVATFTRVALFRQAATAMLMDGFDTIINVNLTNNLCNAVDRIAAVTGRTVRVLPAFADGPPLENLHALRDALGRTLRS